MGVGVNVWVRVCTCMPECLFRCMCPCFVPNVAMRFTLTHMFPRLYCGAALSEEEVLLIFSFLSYSFFLYVCVLAQVFAMPLYPCTIAARFARKQSFTVTNFKVAQVFAVLLFPYMRRAMSARKPFLLLQVLNFLIRGR